jgi:hypothetical protein
MDAIGDVDAWGGVLVLGVILLGLLFCAVLGERDRRRSG